MSENLQKFIGIAVMAVIVVVGVVATNNDDSDFDTTRNAAFAKLGDIKHVVEDDGAASEFIKIGDIKGEVKLGGQEGEAVVKESRIELAFESKRGDVTALGGDSVASVIVGDNHFRGVGDAVSALKKLAAGADSLMVENKKLGVRGPLSKVVNSDTPTLMLQTDDGLTLGPLGGEGVFIHIENDWLSSVDTSEYTEPEWTYLRESLFEASENLQRIAKELDIWTTGGTTN